MHPIRPLLLLALGVLTACGGSSDEAPAPAEQGQTSPPTQPDQPTVARSAAEVATPFALPEEERVCPTPFPPGLTLDTPLVAAGEAIEIDEVKRHLCLGFGYAYSDFAKFEVLIAGELERRKAAGEDMSQFVIDDETLAKHIDKQRYDFALRYPTLDFEVEVGRAYISYDLYHEPARQSLLFDRLFLPANPADWPDLTTELVRGFGGDLFVDDAFDSYERRKQRMIDEGLEEIPPEDPILVSTYKDIILRELNSFAQIETHPGRLPPGVLMIVDGQSIPIEAVWSMLEPHVSTMDLNFVRRFLALCKVLEADFAERGVLLSQEEFEQAWPEEGMTYRQKMDQHQMVASQVIGIQSMEAYTLYQRLLGSLRREQGDKLEDEELLREWSPITNEVTGASKRDVEMILSSAWDGDLAAWKPNGWAEARRKIFELQGEIEGGADWTALRELHSEFWDPPMPETGNTPMFSLKLKGAFGMQTRNQLMGMLEESEGNEFVYGKTITDSVFYEQQVGTIVGPRMGSKGYYLMRLSGRTPPLRPLDLSVPLHKQLIQDFYLRVQLHKRAHELLRQGVEDGSVQGL